MENYRHVSAGILCFFDNKRTILLGKEYRYKMNSYYYSEFGGKQEKGETLYETAYRECNEETGYSLSLTLEMVKEAEMLGNYVDYINHKSSVFYRMYYINIQDKPSPIEIKKNKEKQPKGEYEEMVNYTYFNANEVIRYGKLKGTDVKLFPPFFQRLRLLSKSW